jgi:hypothetical protein
MSAQSTSQNKAAFIVGVLKCGVWLIRSLMKARCGSRTGYGGRPFCRALPSRSPDNAATTSQLTTPQPQNRNATERQLSPFATAQPHACADHWKLVGPSDAGLQPSQHLESYSPQIRNPLRFNKSMNRSSYAMSFLGVALYTRYAAWLAPRSAMKFVPATGIANAS